MSSRIQLHRHDFIDCQEVHHRGWTINDTVDQQYDRFEIGQLHCETVGRKPLRALQHAIGPFLAARNYIQQAVAS